MKRIWQFALIGLALISTTIIFQNCGKTFVSDVGSGIDASSLRSDMIPTASSPEMVQMIKTRSCMFDSLVFPLIEELDENIRMLRDSECLSLPRSIETWAAPPDFTESKRRIDEIEGKAGRKFLFGMFIAEAVSTSKVYRDDNGVPFNFSQMCKPGTQGHWGANTCVPHSGSDEYIRYLRFIVRHGMDIGIRDFLFGQAGHQDPEFRLGAFAQEIRQIAQEKGLTVTVGQQPNGPQPEAYAKAFDYIITPLYIDEDHSKPCLARITTGCQPVLFHPDFVRQYNNVIAELDWNSVDDDIHRYAKKPQAERWKLMEKNYRDLNARGVGVILPYRIIYNGAADRSCKGVNEWVYSASDKFECKDEAAWRSIHRGQTIDVRNIASTTPTPAVSTPTPSATPTLAAAKVIVTRQYLQTMGRIQSEIDSDQTGLLYWMSRVQEGVTEAQIAAEFRASDEYFIRSQFLSILKRRVDLPGLEYFKNQLRSGAKTRAQITADLQYTCDNKINGECS